VLSLLHLVLVIIACLPELVLYDIAHIHEILQALVQHRLGAHVVYTQVSECIQRMP